MPRTRFVKLWAILVGTLIFVAMVAFHVAVILPPPGFGSTQEEQQAYIVTLRALRSIFAGAMDGAAALAVTCSWYWGLTRTDLTEAARRGLFIFGTVFLAIWLIVGLPAVGIIGP